MEKQLLLKQIGTNIKILRNSKGISQQELAASIDYEKSNMSRLESGRTNPTIYTLHRIATALDVELMELVNIKEE